MYERVAFILIDNKDFKIVGRLQKIVICQNWPQYACIVCCFAYVTKVAIILICVRICLTVLSTYLVVKQSF